MRFNMAIFPCRPGGKEPITAHGFKDSSRDISQINEWWSKHPEANIGIATGGLSGGLCVVDVDGDAGIEWIRAQENRHGEINTALSLTGKGYQYWFKSERPIKSRVRLAPEIDIRSEGGYVVAPPSLHPNGRSYAWEVSAPLEEVGLLPLPGWLALLLSGGCEHAKKDWSEIARNGASRGARNQTLASVAGHLFRRGVDPKLAYLLLLAFNESCTEQPLPKTEFNRTVDSIAKRELLRRKGGRI